MSVKPKAVKAPLKIAIVGAAPSSRSLAPFEDTSWQIWGCSPNSRGAFPRVDTWFEIHALADLTSDRHKEWSDPYLEWIRTLKCRVIMQANDLVPGSIEYPRDEVVAYFAPRGRDFYTSSIAWMICLAIKEGANEIGLWGIDMATESEYGFERAGCKYWIELARERGIKVFVPAESDLDIATPHYGFDDAKPEARKKKMHAHELRDRIAQGAAERAQLAARLAQLDASEQFLKGALEENTYSRRTFTAWSGPDS